MGGGADALNLGGTTDGLENIQWLRNSVAEIMKEWGITPPAPQGRAARAATAPIAIVPPSPAPPPPGLIYKAPAGVSRIVSLSDLHVPYHDVAAVNAALEMCEDWRPDLVIVNGDLYDSYLISSFEKEPARLGATLQDEFDAARPITKRIDELGCRVVFILGNHEARINALVAKNPGLAKLRSLEWHAMAEIPSRWEILPQHSRYRFEHLDIHHGDIKQGPGGRYVAARMLEDLKRSSLFGHFHRDQFYPEPDGDGVTRGGFGQGHLCNEEEAGKYCRINRWIKGFRSVDMDPETGLYECRSHLIHNGKLRYGERTYVG